MGRGCLLMNWLLCSKGFNKSEQCLSIFMETKKEATLSLFLLPSVTERRVTSGFLAGRVCPVTGHISRFPRVDGVTTTASEGSPSQVSSSDHFVPFRRDPGGGLEPGWFWLKDSESDVPLPLSRRL